MTPIVCFLCSAKTPYACALVSRGRESFAVRAWEVPRDFTITAAPICPTCARRYNESQATEEPKK